MASVETITVLFTDLVGSTGLASRVGPGAAEELRREHFTLLREAIAESDGREVKNVGDGLMVVFQSSSSAASCAVAMQQRLDRHNRRAEEQLMVRIGVSAGEADLEESDYFGPPVVEASRLCTAAAGGQILASRAVPGVRGPVGAAECQRRGPAATPPPARGAAARLRGQARRARGTRLRAGAGGRRRPARRVHLG